MSEPWVRFEDEQLLVVAKPAGVNTHRADEHAQDGMVEWVQRQRPEVSLSLLHRLDKATSGLLLFGKGAVANRSLAAQFEHRTVTKRYELLVVADTRHPRSASSNRPIDGRPAHTRFDLVASGAGFDRYEAVPTSGRTHQVRIHAEALGMPIVGDGEHGGIDGPRLFLHAAGLAFDHPLTAARVELADRPPASFDVALTGSIDAAAPALAARTALESRTTLFDPDDTNCFVWIDRHHDGFAGVRVERLADAALILDARDDDEPPTDLLDALIAVGDLSSVYLQRRPRGGGGAPARLFAGTGAERFEVRELGCRYQIDLGASATSSGLFLDQRETRRRLLTSDLAGRTVLNTFAHTGALSVVAARAGAETLTLDLSKRYLDRARENFRLNDIDPADHDFMYGDALEWLRRFANKGRRFDLVIADPPSSSTPRKSRSKRWTVESGLHTLVERSAGVCEVGGTVFVSTNLRRMTWDRFLAHVEQGLVTAGRTGAIETQTVPLDHRVGPGDPPYLKAAWITLDR